MSIGLNDYVTHPGWVRDVYAEIKMLGYNIIYREIPGLGGDTHHPASNDDAILWATRLRHKTLPLSTEEQALLQPYSDPAAALCPNADTFRSLIRVGGTQTGHIMLPIIGAANEGTRTMAAESSRLAMFGNEADTAVAALLKERRTSAHRNVRRARAPGQLALHARAAGAHRDCNRHGMGSHRARARGRRDRHRGQASDRGSIPDPPLFKALVTLLDDPDLGLRTKAFAILSPIMMSGYKPDATAAARQPEVAKWQTWLAGITAKN